MEKWILIVNLIVNLQNDKEWEPRQAVIQPSFNQLMKFELDLGFTSMEECWEAAANIEGATLVLRPNVTIKSRCEEL
tara:strand:+ start:1052 stop:1282 length:231 start_codon:yes stop_codon:yes gene_type:complete